MTGERSLHPDKGKVVAKPKRKRQPKYILRIPTFVARTTLDVGPSHAPDRHVLSTPRPPIHHSAKPVILSTSDPVVQPTQDPTSLPPPTCLGTPIDSSSIPSSSSMPPSDDRPPPSADHDSVGDDGDDPAPTDRPMIEPYGKGFVPSRVASQAITRHPIGSFEMFRDARIGGERPYWVGEQIWTSLLSHWNSPQYRTKCAIAQKNRASKKGGVLHTGGSITVHEHAIRMAVELGRVVHVHEVFHQTHLRKGTNQFVDERSRKTHEEFSIKLSQVRSSHESCPRSTQQPNDDDDLIRSQCWIDVVGGKKKGRIYGVGQLAANYSARRGGLKHQPSTSHHPDETVVVLT
ncbi:hypothetical protein LR48_Vigan04g118300 [Vigna angularis]|uniref:Uncharacterized protein n=1 Tax=Phaseolus angularis TaxID=3914 RepID=A0A0L9UDK4_PHAAN|nr:hypothetical protein LR48_Vigan04g118300 [Vigna angularis]